MKLLGGSCQKLTNVVSFLALRLQVDLRRRLQERGAEVSWPDLMRDLKQVQSVLIELDGQRYIAFAINSFSLAVLILIAKSFFRPPLTLTLSPRWGERG